MKARLSIHDYQEGILAGNRVVLGKALTLVESSLEGDREIAVELVEKLLPYTGKSFRIGITGVPGVGKSTFIETFGNYIAAQQNQLAVLTIDPSSQLTKGSILGDKTRMEKLSKNPNAFIRPTASGTTLGGVAGNTREAILLCEAAGFNVIFIETVGVGQSETAVRNMVDFFLLLMLAGAGDELQGIKKGIMEMADAIAITKADGENSKKATQAQAEYQHALHLFPAAESGWTTKVLTCSALENTGIDAVWKLMEQYKHFTQGSGYFEQNREQQTKAWFREYVDLLLHRSFQRNEVLYKEKLLLEEQVGRQQLSVHSAAHKLINAYHQYLKSH